MRIALIAGASHGGEPGRAPAERLARDLATGLQALGHQVVVFRPGGASAAEGTLPTTVTDATHVAPYLELAHAQAAARAIRHAHEPFDLVHSHVAAALPFSRFFDAPTVHTVYPGGTTAMARFYREFGDVAYVLLSSTQRALCADVPEPRVVRPGIDPAAYRPGDGGGGYLVALARSAHATTQRLAIEAARAAGVPLLIARGGHGAGARDDGDERRAGARASLDGSRVDERANTIAVLGGARALLSLGDDEPLPLAALEALLCGTPVIATHGSAAAELVEEGLTGFVARADGDVAGAIARVVALDRAAVRARAEERWSHLRMAREHVAVYAEAIERHRARGARPSILAWRAGTAEGG